MNLLIFLACVSCFVFSIVGAYVANQRGRSPLEGLLLGGLLGVFGVLVVACLPRTGSPREIGWRYFAWGGGITAVFVAIVLCVHAVNGHLENSRQDELQRVREEFAELSASYSARLAAEADDPSLFDMEEHKAIWAKDTALREKIKRLENTQ